MKKLKIEKEDAILVVIDFQEKLMPVMKNAQELEQKTVKLIKGCLVLGVPIILTQQYTKGLGDTIKSIKDAMGEYFLPIEKTTFSAMGEPNFVEVLEISGKRTVILTGIETHVCVQQTALDLLEEGYRVFLVDDAVSSRDNTDKKFAQRRISEAGAIGTTYEAVLFELVVDAKNEKFKQISGIVK
jgi:nicotinamidase-related amidase